MSVSSNGDEKDDKVSDLEKPSSPSPTPKVSQTTQEVKDDKQVELHILFYFKPHMCTRDLPGDAPLITFSMQSNFSARL